MASPNGDFCKRSAVMATKQKPLMETSERNSVAVINRSGSLQRISRELAAEQLGDPKYGLRAATKKEIAAYERGLSSGRVGQIAPRADDAVDIDAIMAAQA